MSVSISTDNPMIDENIKLAEKTGASLTQNIDEQGNLVGVGRMNTQETALLGGGGSSEGTDGDNTISAADIRAELFDGDNIVVGKTDNGQSELISGPFANKNKAGRD